MLGSLVMFYTKQWEKKKKVIGEKAYYKRYSENTLKENFILKEYETYFIRSVYGNMAIFSHETEA